MRGLITRPAIHRLDELANVFQGAPLSGRAAGARPGPWAVKVASVGDIRDDRLDLEGLEPAEIEHNVRTEKYLLRPDDVLVTGRSTVVKAALVPPSVERTLADATLLIVRALDPTVPPYLWWYFTSTPGRRRIAARMTAGTVWSLSVASLGALEIPLPPRRHLQLIGQLIDASERAYVAGLEAIRLRREVLRDGTIYEISRHVTEKEDE